MAIADAAVKIENYTTRFSSGSALYADVRTFDTVLMNFIVIGVTANRIPELFREQHRKYIGITLRHAQPDRSQLFWSGCRRSEGGHSSSFGAVDDPDNKS